jgi:hypothetical protein
VVCTDIATRRRPEGGPTLRQSFRAPCLAATLVVVAGLGRFGLSVAVIAVVVPVSLIVKPRREYISGGL